jgi:hypothetical protein
MEDLFCGIGDELPFLFFHSMPAADRKIGVPPRFSALALCCKPVIVVLRLARVETYVPR